MRCYPEHDDFTPLFIVGLPRAGTRFLADALNLSDEVCIQGEVIDQAVTGLRAMFTKLDVKYDAFGKLDRWRQNRQHLTAAVWANASKTVPRPLPENCRFYGFKSPQHERYFDFYEDVFADNPPRWIFCVRNFRDQFSSVASMAWRRNGRKATVEYIGTEYVQALDALDAMRSAAAERVFPFVLDNHIADSPGYLSGILGRIGVTTDAELLTRMVGLGKRNSAESKGIDLHVPTEDEERWIADHPDLSRRFDEISLVSYAGSGDER